MTKRKNTETAVATVEPMTQAIAVAQDAGDIPGLKNIAAMATGLKEAARKRGLGIADENKAAEVVIRAERAIGGLLPDGREVQRSRAADREWRPKVDELVENLPTLPELGISQFQATQFRALAAMPDEEFESLLAARRERGERLARVDFVRAALPTKQKGGSIPMGNLREVDRTDPSFATWRAATHELLGRIVGEGGEVGWLDRPFEHTHVDDLVELAGLIRQLADAYTTEQKARS